MDIDASLIDSLTDSLVNKKESRDGLPKTLFPLRSAALHKYDFVLLDTKDYKGRLTHRVSFTPKKRDKKCTEPGDDNDFCDPEIWKGDAYIDAAELQPVHIATDLAYKIPFVVRSMLGTNLRQTGFAVTYKRLAENVWFPVSYGTEFRFNLLFGYKRVVTMSLESTDFRRATADSAITFDQEVAPVR